MGGTIILFVCGLWFSGSNCFRYQNLKKRRKTPLDQTLNHSTWGCVTLNTKASFSINALLTLWSTRVLTIYMENPKISVGKSNGSRHSVWEASENMGCLLRRFLVCSADLDCSGSFSHHVRFSSVMFMHKISTWMVCLNGKHPCRAAFRVNSRIGHLRVPPGLCIKTRLSAQPLIWKWFLSQANKTHFHKKG